MFENGPSDRMQLVGVGDLLPPGSCIVCGNGTCQEGYVRFGVSLEFEGELYLCWFCVVQAAEILGCLIPAEAKTLRDIADAVAEDNSTLRKENEIVNERLKAFDSALGPYLTTSLDTSGIFSNPSGEESSSESQATSESGGESSGLQPEPAESTKSDRPKRTVRLAASDTPSAGIL